MAIPFLNQHNTVIVAASISDFKQILFWSEAILYRHLNIIPIQSEREINAAIEENPNTILVIDPKYALTSAQERVIQKCLTLGMNWCSTKIYLGQLKGFAEVENLGDVLEWMSGKNQNSESFILSKTKCLTRRFIACMLLTLTSPLLALIASTIAISSPGSVFYKQTRVGFRGRKFNLLKFRSMHLNAEASGPQWSSGDADPRTFAFGRFLRKTHLDELPQLWNVIQGDLCFVGPRPERPEFHALLEEAIPHFDLRTMVKPGITGWAQLFSGYAASIEESKRKIAHDLFYIRNTHSRMSFAIVLKTAEKVIREVFNFVVEKFINKNKEVV
jgi:lipopolysaccharide/colanic/teichoic acid biosynthesis glycosyltransferase